jgi:hypothetical protein
MAQQRRYPITLDVRLLATRNGSSRYHRFVPKPAVKSVIDAAKQQAYVGEARGSDVRRLVATEAQTGSKFG